MKNWVRMLVLTFFCHCGVALAAPKILLIHTNEGASTHVNNAISEFAGATVMSGLDVPGAVTASTFTAANGGPFDVVVLVSVYVVPDSSNVNAITTAAASRAFSSLVTFIDTCLSCAGSLPRLSTIVGTLAPFSVAFASYDSGYYNFPLNTASAYSSSFSSLNPLRSNRFHPFASVPASNALYLMEGALPASTGTVMAHTLIVPGTESASGQGACLIASSDASQFDPAHYPANTGKIATTILAALGVAQSCRVSPATGAGGPQAVPVPATGPLALLLGAILLALTATCSIAGRAHRRCAGK